MALEVAFQLVNVGNLDKIALPPPDLRKGATSLGCGGAARRQAMTVRQSGDCTMRVEKE